VVLLPAELNTNTPIVHRDAVSLASVAAPAAALAAAAYINAKASVWWDLNLIGGSVTSARFLYRQYADRSGIKPLGCCCWKRWPLLSHLLGSCRLLFASFLTPPATAG
jgi:hypothetical protein